MRKKVDWEALRARVELGLDGLNGLDGLEGLLESK